MDIPVITINRKQNYTQSPSAHIEIHIENFESTHSAAINSRRPPTILLVYTESVPIEMRKYNKKIESFGSLGLGWNGYSAPAPTRTAMAIAKRFVASLLASHDEPSRLAPSAVGGVGITHRRNGRKVYVEFFNDGKVYALFSDGHSEPSSKEIEAGYLAFQVLIAEMQEYLDAGYTARNEEESASTN